MSEPHDFIDERLARLGAATGSVEPGKGFDDWVLAAVAKREGARGLELPWRTGRWALLAATVAAAASVLLAVRAESTLDEQVLSTLDGTEVDP